jgi:hypothetical protein
MKHILAKRAAKKEDLFLKWLKRFYKRALYSIVVMVGLTFAGEGLLQIWKIIPFDFQRFGLDLLISGSIGGGMMPRIRG